MTQAPPASETRKQLENAGIDPDEIDKVVNEYKQLYAGAVKENVLEDMATWAAARQKFQLNVAPLTDTSGDGDVRVRCENLQAATVRDGNLEIKGTGWFEWEGYILNQYTYDKKEEKPEKRHRLRATLIDKTGVAPLMSFMSDCTESWEAANVQPGDYVRITSFGGFAPSEDFRTFTFGSYATVEKVTPNYEISDCVEVLPEAMDESYLDVDEYGLLRGVVVEENRRSFSKGEGMQKRMGEFHEIVINSGGAHQKATIPPDLAPHDDLEYCPVTAVVRREVREYTAQGETRESDELNVVWFSAGGKAYASPREELEAQANADAAALEGDDAAPTPENVLAFISEHGEDSGVEASEIHAVFDGPEIAIDESIDSLKDEGHIYSLEFGVFRATE